MKKLLFILILLLSFGIYSCIPGDEAIGGALDETNNSNSKDSVGVSKDSINQSTPKDSANTTTPSTPGTNPSEPKDSSSITPPTTPTTPPTTPTTPPTTPTTPPTTPTTPPTTPSSDINLSYLAGSWRLVHNEGYSPWVTDGSHWNSDYDELHPSSCSDRKVEYIKINNGHYTFNQYSFRNGRSWEKFKSYNIYLKDNEIIPSNYDSAGLCTADKFEIIKLNSTELIIYHTISGGYYDKSIYKRMK